MTKPTSASPTPAPQTNQDWWPDQLDLRVLHQNTQASNPLSPDFDYAAAFQALDLDALKRDVARVMTTSQDWWPADWGNYGPLFIRMAWHSAGTYRAADGRGGASDGTQRFAPLNSWPDNANLDKARRLLWPVKQKYGQSISWADLMVLAGNVALESAGFRTIGFAGGREDVWEPQNDIFWGPESEWLDDMRHDQDGALSKPLGAVEMGLIYVNPEGPHGKPDPLAAAKDIREAFGRMGMNDKETVALIVGGHTLGKAHGAASPEGNVGPEPEGAKMEEQGLGWKNRFQSGKGVDTITSGLEGAWTSTPTKWSNGFLENLYQYEWELTKSPAGAWQWAPKNGPQNVPDAHEAGKFQAPIMLTTDLALKEDPIYGGISKEFHKHPALLNEAFAQAWYKLTHRDMGPAACFLGPEVATVQLWQDPIPKNSHELVDVADIEDLKSRILKTGLSISELVTTAWASASTFRSSDKRGGANGARIRLLPQREWDVNEPQKLARVLKAMQQLQADFHAEVKDGKRISLADLIVLGGCAALEVAAKEGGHPVKVPFTPGRMDTTQGMTDAASFAELEPLADGFRNYCSEGEHRPPAVALIDQANRLSLTAPEMTALLGGMRVLGTNHKNTSLGVLTERPEVLSNDFFVHLLSMDVEWSPSTLGKHHFDGIERGTHLVKWTATSIDLLFGSHSQLRALAEVYASADGERKFVEDCITAWTKVMNLDRFDLTR